jgi:DNA-binding NtrC family response regulator
MPSLNILLHGWDLEFQSAMTERMAGEGWTVFQTQSEDDLGELLESQEIDVTILDMCSAPNPGLNWIDTIKTIQPHAQVICITPKDNVGLSISGMRHGAFDDLQFPFSWTSLMKKVQAAGKHKARLIRKETRPGFWQSVEDHLYAGSLAQAGAPDVARTWLRQKKAKKKTQS